MSIITIIENVTVYLEGSVISPAWLKFENGKITAIQTQAFAPESLPSAQLVRWSLTPDDIVMPGFIDTHIHGIANHDVMDATPNALAAIANVLPSTGTTAFCATTMTAPTAAITAALRNVGQYPQASFGAELLGVHLEGPFIAKTRAGAHPVEAIINPDMRLLNDWQMQAAHRIKIVTIAPELPGAMDFIRYLTEQGIIASLGHSAADYVTTMQAIKAGASQVTHLFNAMSPIHHRQPGLAIAALLAEELKAELIVDNVHVHAAMLALVARMKSAEGILLITDSMRASCCGDGHYHLGEQAVVVKDKVARLVDGTLAGSVLTMLEAVRQMMTQTGADLAELIQMAAVNPAKQLGVWERKGSLAVGKDADVLVLNKHLTLQMSFCRGALAYQQAELVGVSD